ncbi:hypothetical protein AOC10_01770 [Polynucleobacter asymbioticus]|uniref:hypothetical protein n=1 Tax=Polynucleobacter asymbioticus TaxID=576611 RepID=UPI0008FAFF2E|nr:hypothetical protein [Polynucleobacter asymbioticus]APC05344.1 hypothetical protein AOC10_01770 [Polynucleobacter asymbioticus]
MSSLRQMASFIRWQLVPMRYLTMIRDLRWNQLFQEGPSKSSICEDIEDLGVSPAQLLNQDQLDEINSIYQPRIEHVVKKSHGHPFVNLFTGDDITPSNPVFNLAFSKEVLDVAADYFGNKLILDSMQVLYSYSTDGEVRESQKWHLDYGDNKTFHAVVYLNDVLNADDGPFIYADKHASKKLGRPLIMNRIPDLIPKSLEKHEVHEFLGNAGAMVYVDPAACYHYGSRCKKSRMAIFITFSTWFPYAKPVPLIIENREKIFSTARKVRPDLSKKFLRTLLQLA